ncbi:MULTISPECIES: PLP-dependent transferase [unclassified Acinetobacter]|uniref:PLP-dependent transferase n=1 Tax=unclassified Acinetobacter TaxID=196816 RepID=UPI0035B9DCF5
MDLHIQTRLSQPVNSVPDHVKTLQMPVFRASTFVFDNTQDMIDAYDWTRPYNYSYGTHGTPTTYALADQIAVLEGAKHCLLAPSGLSVIQLVNSTFLASGDEVWLPENSYYPNHEHLSMLQERYGVVLKSYNPVDVESFQPTEKCKLLWLEAAGSVSLEFPDLIGLIKKAKAKGILTAIDSTWGAGLAYNSFDLDDEHTAVDISVHALTKYPSGGGDILMGSVCTADRELYLKVLKTHALQGIAVSGDDCANIQRNLASMALRYQKHHDNTLALIDYLSQCKEFSQVLHPSIASHAGHEYWQAVCKTGLGAGLVSVVVDGAKTVEQIQAFCNQLNLFKLGYSWGGATSLVMYYQVQRQAMQHEKPVYIVRFVVGLEHIDDLIQDIEQARVVFA